MPDRNTRFYSHIPEKYSSKSTDVGSNKVIFNNILPEIGQNELGGAYEDVCIPIVET